MFGHEVQSEYALMAQHLDEAGLSGYKRDHALAMFARGALIGTALCKLWDRLRRV